MATARQYRIAEHEGPRPEREATLPPPSGNDNFDAAAAADELARAKERTWNVFARWLALGGLGFALILLAVLTFIYSGYP